MTGACGLAWSTLFGTMKPLWETDTQKRPQRVTRRDKMAHGEMISLANLSQQYAHKSRISKFDNQVSSLARTYYITTSSATMNTSSFARVVTLLLATSSIASAAKSSSSSKSHQSILATPVSISKSSKGSADKLSSNKRGKKNKTKGSSGMQRMTLQARTTLGNVELDELSPAECIFFEDTWMAAYKTVHAKDDGDEKKLKIRSVVVEENSNDPHGPPGNRSRQLRGGSTNEDQKHRSLWYIFSPPTFYFDIWTLIELTCILCRDDDDDSVGWGDDDDDFYGYKEPGTRHLDPQDDEEEVENKFESLLCGMLREGPFETFQEAEDCQVTYVASP